MQEACLGVGSLSVLGSEAWGISSSKGFAVIQLFAFAAGSSKVTLSWRKQLGHVVQSVGFCQVLLA